MKNFVIEQMGGDGNIQSVAYFSTEQRLLNDTDLYELTACVEGKMSSEMVDCIVLIDQMNDAEDIRRILIREYYDTYNAYYYDGEGWLYGTIENAINNIKRQL